MDSNPTRARQARQRAAFQDVLGDPFAHPEPIDGMYQRLKRRSTVGAVQNNFSEGRGTANPARPSSSDFFVDVERVVEEILAEQKISLRSFDVTYLETDIENPSAINKNIARELEERIGRMFIALQISPVSEYFKTVRQRVGA